MQALALGLHMHASAACTAILPPSRWVNHQGKDLSDWNANQASLLGAKPDTFFVTERDPES